MYHRKAFICLAMLISMVSVHSQNLKFQFGTNQSSPTLSYELKRDSVIVQFNQNLIKKFEFSVKEIEDFYKIFDKLPAPQLNPPCFFLWEDDLIISTGSKTRRSSDLSCNGTRAYEEIEKRNWERISSLANRIDSMARNKFSREIDSIIIYEKTTSFDNAPSLKKNTVIKSFATATLFKTGRFSEATLKKTVNASSIVEIFHKVHLGKLIDYRWGCRDAGYVVRLDGKGKGNSISLYSNCGNKIPHIKDPLALLFRNRRYEIINKKEILESLMQLDWQQSFEESREGGLIAY